MASALSSLFRIGKGGLGNKHRSGTEDEKRWTYHTTPWAWRNVDGCYVGLNKEVWLYRQMPLSPLTWEDPQTQLQLGNPLAGVIAELGATSTDMGGTGFASLSRNREIHLVSITWDDLAVIPDDTPDQLRAFLNETLSFLVPRRVLLLGVKLRSSVMDSGSSNTVLGSLKGMATRTLGEDVPDLVAYEKDREVVVDIITRYRGVVPERDALNQLESWYNDGRGPDAAIHEARDLIYVDGDIASIELAAVTEFEETLMNAPYDSWILDALTHPDGPCMVSVRAELLPSTVFRSQMRRGQRRMLSQLEEEAATGDLERTEQSGVLNLAKALEDHVASSREPWLTSASIIMGRRTRNAVETYIDELKATKGITVKPLEHRQLAALNECLPCSDIRVNPFTQVASISTLAYSGIQGYSALGDTRGAFIGLTDPDFTPCFLDFLGAPADNAVPVMGVFGDPGSGKAQPLDAPVLTPLGWSTMGEINVGDDVIAVDGTATKVMAVYPQGLRPIYRVRFHDGASVEADAEHLWMVAKSREMSNGAGFKTMNTKELLDVGLRDSDGKRRWRIPVVAPVQHPHADLPLDPYMLGLLIGDATMTTRIAFSSLDQQLVTKLRESVPAGIELTREAPPRECDYRLSAPGTRRRPNELIDALRGLGLYSKTSLEKFLPRAYLHGSVTQRTSLLQGLMDTDGEPTPNGAARFYTSSPNLARDVTELVESLGGTTRLTSKMPTFTYKKELRTGSQAFSLAIRLPKEVAPFRLARKVKIWESIERPEPVRIIDAIEYVGEKQAQCILVNHPDHLYVTANHIVTHNTFACQLIAIQAVMAGLPCIFINPKGMQSLKPTADLVGGTTVVVSQLEEEGGYFDPFLYAEDPEKAAEMLSSHILIVLGNSGVQGQGFTQDEEISLTSGIRRGALAGARCAFDALQYVADQHVIETVLSMVESSPTFGLGFGMKPRERWSGMSGLTLIEFDRELDLPEKGQNVQSYSRQQRVSVAALRLVTRASLEILVIAQGGVMIMDEAWSFLSSEEGRAAVQSLGRKGRSWNILPIFATQRVADLLQTGVDMKGFMSRVLVMKLDDEVEAAAALTLCGLEPTVQRINWLKTIGPHRRKDTGQIVPARALHRDLNNRHAAITITPVPAVVSEAFSTNPVEVAKREARRAEADAANDAANNVPPPA
jgi:hypothetical protein